MSTPAWMEHAACTTKEKRGLPWTTDTSATPTVLVDLMRETCDGCPVRLACQAYAKRNRVSGGWWCGVDQADEPADLLDLLDALPAGCCPGRCCVMRSEQTSIFDLIEDPTPRPAPTTYLNELPAHYAKIAHQGCPWHWMVSRSGHVLAAGFCKTQAEAEARTAEALAEALATPEDGAA